MEKQLQQKPLPPAKEVTKDWWSKLKTNSKHSPILGHVRYSSWSVTLFFSIPFHAINRTFRKQPND